MKWFNPFTWFPWSQEGRATAVYLGFLWSVPALTALLRWAMGEIATFPGAEAGERLTRFANLADKIVDGVLLGMIVYACFISIRALKVGKDGLDVHGNEDAGAGAQIVADAAQVTADKVKDAG